MRKKLATKIVKGVSIDWVTGQSYTLLTKEQETSLANHSYEYQYIGQGKYRVNKARAYTVTYMNAAELQELIDKLDRLKLLKIKRRGKRKKRKVASK